MIKISILIAVVVMGSIGYPKIFSIIRDISTAHKICVNTPAYSRTPDQALFCESHQNSW